MSRPVTLFTGQWADLPLETRPARQEDRLRRPGTRLLGRPLRRGRRRSPTRATCKEKWELLADHGLTCFAISSHLVGQAVCDQIDERHKAILPPDVWGDGEPEGVRKRAAEEDDHHRARPPARSSTPSPAATARTTSRPSSTASPAPRIWHSIYAFPPTSQDYWEKGFDDFAKRWLPILDAFDKENVNFALEVHPTEIAFDIASRPARARGGRRTTSASASTTTRRTSATRAWTT